MQGPTLHGGESAFLIRDEEGAHGELSGAKTGEVRERLQRVIEVVGTKRSHEIAEEDADETMLQQRREFSQDLELTAVAAGQCGLDGDGALMKALHERARFESFKHKWQINFRAKLGLKSREM